MHWNHPTGEPQCAKFVIERQGFPLDMLSLATFLYEGEGKTGPRLEIPAKFTDDE